MLGWAVLTNEEDDEDGNDTTLDPRINRLEIVATTLASSELTIGSVSTNGEFLVEGTEVDEGEHEELNRGEDENVVDVESGVAVVEGKETIHGELGTEVVVLSREHLFSHSRSNLGLEIENRSESEITTFTALFWEGDGELVK